MKPDDALIRAAQLAATGATAHEVAGLLAKYRMAIAVRDQVGAAAAERNLRRHLVVARWRAIKTPAIR